MISCRLMWLCLLACSVVANADDPTIYESFADVRIGRVFMSPVERRQLDIMRMHPERFVEASSQPATEQAQAAPTVSPAGYIIVGSGTPKYWGDGDFSVAGERSTSTMKFPGDVAIIRHTNATDTPENPAGVSGDRLYDTASDMSLAHDPAPDPEADTDEQ